MKPEAGNFKVIVLGLKESGLSVAQTLGKRGMYIIGVSYDDTEYGLHSRYLHEKVLSPHPKDSRAFADFLIQRQDMWAGALLLETNDYYMRALSEHKSELSTHYRLITPDKKRAALFIEKDKTYALADSANIPHPNIFSPGSLAELDALSEKMLFPVMIKPVISHEFVQIFGVKTIICASFEELRRNFQKVLAKNQAVILSEIIPGTDYGTLERVQLYINSKGDISAEFFNIKLRQTPPLYGVMRVGKSMPVNHEVLELTRRLLKAADYRGYASVEFKRDFRDNQLKLIEVNIRQPQSSNLSIKSGIDFPWIIFQDLMMDKQVRVENYHENTYLIDLGLDLVYFLLYDPSKNVLHFLRPYFGRKTYYYFNTKDMKPFWKMLQHRVQHFFPRIMNRKRPKEQIAAPTHETR